MNHSATIGIVGCGYWGGKLLAKFLANRDCVVSKVCELDSRLRASLNRQFPDLNTTDAYDDLLSDGAVTSVVLATSPATHYTLARKALEAGKHVWIEKPLATSLVQGRELVQLAQDKGRVLFVDHTFLYDPLVQRIRRLIADGELGDIYHVYFQRLNLGRIKRDSNVWWNSAPHDVSLLLYLLGDQPASITVHGYRYLQPQIEDLNMGVIEMRGGASAFIYHNWLSPENTASVTVVGSRKLLAYEGKFDKRAVSVYEYSVEKDYRSGSDLPMTIPSRITQRYKLEDTPEAEPLANAVQDFVASIHEGRSPLSDGKFSLQVLAVLEAGATSLRSGGSKISL